MNRRKFFKSFGKAVAFLPFTPAIAKSIVESDGFSCGSASEIISPLSMPNDLKISGGFENVLTIEQHRPEFILSFHDVENGEDLFGGFKVEGGKIKFEGDLHPSARVFGEAFGYHFEQQMVMDGWQAPEHITVIDDRNTDFEIYPSVGW